MSASDLSLFAVFLTGLLGGVHCAGMCGGIVSALGMMRQKPVSTLAGITVTSSSPLASASARTGSLTPSASSASSAPSAVAAVSLYNLGRITTYTVLGALAGAIGSVAWLVDSMLPVQQTAYLLSKVLIILMGLYVIGIRQIATVVESAGAGVWKRVRPAATRTLSGTGVFNSVMAGALWGMVPCGMVYAVLSAALVSGSAFKGALLMLVFGLGTLPNLMMLGLSGQWLAKASRHKIVRVLAGLMIIGFGLMGLMHLGMMGSM